MWEELDIQMGDSVFIPMKVLNEVRHQALEELEEQLLGKIQETVSFFGKITGICRKAAKYTRRQTFLYYASCEDSPTAARCFVRKIRIPAEFIFLTGLMETVSGKGTCKGQGNVSVPAPYHQGEAISGWATCEQIEKWLKQGMTGFLVRNLESLQPTEESLA